MKRCCQGYPYVGSDSPIDAGRKLELSTAGADKFPFSLEASLLQGGQQVSAWAIHNGR